MNNAPRKRLGAYTVPMLKRFGLLAVPTVIIALLGGSIVLAQQSAPNNLPAPAPEATPESQGPTGPTGPTASTPIAGGPSNAPAATPTPLPVPQATPITSGPAAPPQPSAGAAYLAANVPANLQVVPELPQPLSPQASPAAMTVGDGTLRPVPEEPSIQSLFPAPMVGDDAKRATELPQPPSGPTALNAPSPNLVPVPER